MPVHIATHQISLHGMSGGIFWSVLAALIFYVLGFATVGWEKHSTSWNGLWMVCTSSTDYVYQGEDWFKATQAMMTIGLVLLLAGCLTIFIYMFIHSPSISKSRAIMAFTVMIFIAAAFMLVGFLLFGIKHTRGDLHWSFAFCVIGGIMCVIAGILAICQMKQSNVV